MVEYKSRFTFTPEYVMPYSGWSGDLPVDSTPAVYPVATTVALGYCSVFTYSSNVFGPSICSLEIYLSCCSFTFNFLSSNVTSLCSALPWDVPADADSSSATQAFTSVIVMFDMDDNVTKNAPKNKRDIEIG